MNEPQEDTGADADAIESFESVSKTILRMKSGAPIVRYSEVGSSGVNRKPDVQMCFAYLNDSMDQIVFVLHPKSDVVYDSPLSVLLLSKVEQVEASNIDKFSVALLLPEELEIAELIFATEEDWNCWLCGLKALCSRQIRSDETQEQCDEPQEELDQSSPDLEELYSLVDRLENQNDLLKRIKAEYEISLNDANETLERKDGEIHNLKLLLELRDDTIRELSGSLHSLVTKQSIIVAKLTSSSCSGYAVPLELDKAPLKPIQLNHGLTHSSKSTSGSGTFELKGLQSLEEQLKLLNERKRHLESLLASA